MISKKRNIFTNEDNIADIQTSLLSERSVFLLSVISSVELTITLSWLTS